MRNGRARTASILQDISQQMREEKRGVSKVPREPSLGAGVPPLVDSEEVEEEVEVEEGPLSASFHF